MPIAMLSTSLLTNPQKYGRFNALDTENPFATKPGMVLLTDYTIDHAGTSASLTNGQVTFTAVTSLSLNGVFTADFDNYVVSWRHVGSSSSSLFGALRASGADATTGYTSQRLLVDGTTVSGTRFTGETAARIGSTETSARNGDTLFIYGPALAQPTAFRGVNVRSESGAFLLDQAATHSLSTSYDGITITANTHNITGAIQVYGVRS